jgi:hypothetical protein
MLGLELQAYNKCMKCRCGPPPRVFLSLHSNLNKRSNLLVRREKKYQLQSQRPEPESNRLPALNWVDVLWNAGADHRYGSFFACI